MKKLLTAVATAFLLASFAASAEHSMTRRAFVVSVDNKAKTITFRYKVDGAAKDATAAWDDKTEWEDGEGGPSKPATAALAAKLKKDSKIFIDFTDRDTNDQKWWISSVKTLPANFDMP